MLQVDLDNILPEEDALGRVKEIFDRVENQKEIYVVTKSGKPVFAIVDIDRLQQDQGILNAVTPPVASAPASTPAPEPTPAPAAPAFAAPAPSAPAPTLPPLGDITTPSTALPEVAPLSAPAAPATEVTPPAMATTPAVTAEVTPPATATSSFTAPAQPFATPAAPADGLPDMPADDLTNDSPLA